MSEAPGANSPLFWIIGVLWTESALGRTGSLVSFLRFTADFEEPCSVCTEWAFEIVSCVLALSILDCELSKVLSSEGLRTDALSLAVGETWIWSASLCV